MKGHDELIKMRMLGKTPQSVTIYDYPFDVDWTTYNDLPRVSVHGDYIVDVNLLFVVGMTVQIESHDEKRAEALFNKCIDYGASIVTASSYPSPKQDPYSRVESKSRIFFRHFENKHDNHHIARFN